MKVITKAISKKSSTLSLCGMKLSELPKYMRGNSRELQDNTHSHYHRLQGGGGGMSSGSGSNSNKSFGLGTMSSNNKNIKTSSTERLGHHQAGAGLPSSLGSGAPNICQMLGMTVMEVNLSKNNLFNSEEVFYVS